MNKKIIAIIILLVLIIAGGIVAIKLKFSKNDSVPSDLTNIQDISSINNIEDISTSTDSEESVQTPLLEIEEVGFVDNSGKVSDKEIIKAIKEKSITETTSYLKEIFTYSGDNKAFKKQIKKRMADTEEYPITKSYYPTSIAASFKDINLISSVKDVNILAISVADELDGEYSVLVRGYVDTEMESDKFEKNDYHVIFEDYLLIEKDNISHFNTTFNYVINNENFTYGLKDDGSNSVRYNGSVVYEFDLESYNPEYKEADKLQDNYEDSIEKQIASETDATDSED